MHHARQQLAGDLIHIRYHQQQALGSGIGGSQRARGKRAVYRAGSAGLGLHLNDLNLAAKNILLPLGSPFVHAFSHW